MIIENLLPAIETLVGNKLGSSWSKLSHVYHIEKNRFDGATLKYGVIPIGAVPALGQTKFVTRGQGFEILLTESYITDAISDEDLRSKVLSLCGKMEELEVEMIKEKAGYPSAENVLPFTIENAMIVKKEKVILVQASFVVQYRIQIT